jgi:hypothetical protein
MSLLIAPGIFYCIGWIFTANAWFAVLKIWLRLLNFPILIPEAALAFRPALIHAILNYQPRMSGHF